MKALRLTAVVGFCLLTASISAQKSIAVHKGQKYEVEIKSLMNSTTEAMGQSVETTVESKSTTQYEIMNTSSDGIDIQNTITRLKINTSIMGQESKYDSDEKDNEGPLADKLAGRVNKPSLVTIDSKGTIIKRETVPEDDELLGFDDSQKTNTDLFHPVFLSRELTTGLSFVDSFNVKKEKYESNEVGTYVVKKVDNGIATIEYTAQQKVFSVMEQMGMEMNNNSVNDISTAIRLDLGTGLILSKETVINSNLTIETSGMSFPATAKTTVSVSIKPMK